jgi:hypothetical protein
MTSEILVDALPYFDTGFDEPGVRDMVKNSKIFFCLQISKRFEIFLGSCYGR